MIKEIIELETAARRLEPAPSQRQQWWQEIAEYSEAFLQQIEQLKAYDIHPENGRGILDLEFRDPPRAMEDLLPQIHKHVDHSGINPASGGHLGYIPGGGVWPTALGDYLAALTNRYAGVFFANPGAVRIENQVIRWMCNQIGYPEEALGNLTSGGSIANLTAIVTARDYHQIKSRVVEKAVIYLTQQVHHCVQKALRIAGLGESVIRYIPMDERFRMQADQLKVQIEKDLGAGLKPFLIVASAGTTDTGSIDPLDQIADIADQFDLWFHIDAAYGGFFTMLDEFKSAFRGIERSDSLTIDPHKGLFLAYGLGAVLVKNVKALYQSHYYQANYMQDAIPDHTELSPADLSPELTKHFRGMRMWLSMQLLGLAPFRAALKEKILLCRYFYQKVQELGFEVGPDPELSVCIYRFIPPKEDPNAFNEKLVKMVQQDGRIFLSSTRIDGVFWIRLAVLSFRTHLKQIDLCLEILQNSLKLLLQSNSQIPENQH